jgi:RHS repeat-associated protein
VEVRDRGDDSLIATYEYDGQKRRIEKTVNSTTEDIFYNSEWQILEVRTADDTDPSEQYIWDIRYVDAPVVRFQDADTDGTVDNTLYYTNDANMNVTALVDESGTVVERYAYDPYGERTVLDGDWSTDADGVSDVNNALGHQGLHLDSESALYYNRNRYYSPSLGRFITRDPLGYVDGMSVYEYRKSSRSATADPEGTIVVGLSGAGEGKASLEPLTKHVTNILAFSLGNVLNERIVVRARWHYGGPLKPGLFNAGYDGDLKEEYTAFVKRKAQNPCSVEQFVTFGHSSGASAVYNLTDKKEFAKIAAEHKPAGDDRRYAPTFLGFIDMVLMHDDWKPERWTKGDLGGSELAGRAFNIYQQVLTSVIKGKPISGVKQVEFSKQDHPKMGHHLIQKFDRTKSLIAAKATRNYLMDVIADVTLLDKKGLAADFDHESIESSREESKTYGNMHVEIRCSTTAIVLGNYIQRSGMQQSSCSN